MDAPDQRRRRDVAKYASRARVGRSYRGSCRTGPLLQHSVPYLPRDQTGAVSAARHRQGARGILAGRRAHRDRRPDRHRDAQVVPARQDSVHHVLSHALSRIRARAHSAADGDHLRVAAALPWPVDRDHGAHARDSRRSRAARLQAPRALVARRRFHAVPSGITDAECLEAPRIHVRRARRGREEYRRVPVARIARNQGGRGRRSASCRARTKPS